MDSAARLSSALVFVLAGAAAAQPGSLSYDPALGTLPSAQGFTLASVGDQPEARVSGGLLLQGPTAYSGVQCWLADRQNDFDVGMTIEAEMYVVDCTYMVNGCNAGQRSGYYLGAVDRFGRIMYVGFANNAVYLMNNTLAYQGVNAPSAAIPMAGRWRKLRLEIAPMGATLFVDGVKTLTAPIGQAGQSPTINRVLFGDGTACGASWTRLRSANFVVHAPCPADFNNDGFVDLFDFDDFFTCFDGGACPPGRSADFNEDGFVDFFDLDDFILAFEEGCGGGQTGGGGSGEGSGEGNGGGSGGEGGGNGGGTAG